MVSLVVVSALICASPSVGFGVGQTLGDHLLTPTLFTMRVGVGKSLVIAPEVNVRYSHSDDDIDSTEWSDLALGVESNFYRAFWKGDRTGFYGVLGVGAELSRETSQYYEHHYPDSVYSVKETVDTRVYGLNLGLGIEHFFRNNLSLCITSLSNILYESEKSEREWNGQKAVSYDRSGYSFDFQNLRCNIFLVWYL